MDADRAKELMERGIDYLEKGWANDAVAYFEEVLEKYGRNAAVLSWLGLAIARAKKGDLRPAEKLCLEAIEKEHYNAICYRNLAEVYLIWGKRKKAINVLRKGLPVAGARKILIDELQKLGLRQGRAISFLQRSNPLNRYIGTLRYKFSSRDLLQGG